MDYLINSKSTKPKQGVTYFVHWKNGLDTNDGLSPEKPLKTEAAAWKLIYKKHDLENELD